MAYCKAQSASIGLIILQRCHQLNISKNAAELSCGDIFQSLSCDLNSGLHHGVKPSDTIAYNEQAKRRLFLGRSRFLLANV